MTGSAHTASSMQQVNRLLVAAQHNRLYEMAHRPRGLPVTMWEACVPCRLRGTVRLTASYQHGMYALCQAVSPRGYHHDAMLCPDSCCCSPFQAIVGTIPYFHIPGGSIQARGEVIRKHKHHGAGVEPRAQTVLWGLHATSSCCCIS